MDKCPNCNGLWLDHHELDALEDTVLSEDHMKGTMLYAQRGSEISCPKCHDSMTTFNYRAYDLPIDFCSKGHGFWLDKGEEKRVLELMEKRIRDLGRASSAQAQWTQFVKGARSPSLMDKIKGLFR